MPTVCDTPLSNGSNVLNQMLRLPPGVWLKKLARLTVPLKVQPVATTSSPVGLGGLSNPGLVSRFTAYARDPAVPTIIKPTAPHNGAHFRTCLHFIPYS